MKKDGVSKDEEKKASSDYGQRLADVKKMKEMTDTDAFQEFYSGLKLKVETHAELILTSEKSREVIAHQEGVKVIRDIMASFSKPVKALNAFVSNMPLFSALFPIRAEWNEALGKIILKEISK